VYGYNTPWEIGRFVADAKTGGFVVGEVPDASISGG
jgi:hypothetical protein